MKKEAKRLQAKIPQKGREQRHSEESHGLAVQNIMNSGERPISEQVGCIGASMAEKERAKIATIEGQVEQYRSALAKEEGWKTSWKNKTEQAEGRIEAMMQQRNQELQILESKVHQKQRKFYLETHS